MVKLISGVSEPVVGINMYLIHNCTILSPANVSPVHVCVDVVKIHFEYQALTECMMTVHQDILARQYRCGRQLGSQVALVPKSINGINSINSIKIVLICINCINSINKCQIGVNILQY